MLTNELKKGDIVRLKNGWDAKLEDNMKGNIRTCTVYGLFTEMGSVYSHDMVYKHDGDGVITDIIQHTPEQDKCRQRANAFGF